MMSQSILRFQSYCNDEYFSTTVISIEGKMINASLNVGLIDVYNSIISIYLSIYPSIYPSIFPSIYQSIYLSTLLSVQAVARTGAVQDRRRVWCTQDKKQSGLWKGTWSNSTRYISTVVQLYSNLSFWVSLWKCRVIVE